MARAIIIMCVATTVPRQKSPGHNRVLAQAYGHNRVVLCVYIYICVCV